MNVPQQTTGRQEVEVAAGPAQLKGFLLLPQSPRGMVLFAHGTGSSRFSQRNNFVAERLLEGGFGSLLFNLLQESESENDSVAVDMGQLADRLRGAAGWLRDQPEIGELPTGYFGASTGAAVALIAAARSPDEVSSVVSRGGRIDLARDYLSRVQAPTLLIVGGNDQPVLLLNEECEPHLRCRKELAVVQGAGHLFEEPGTLEEVARRSLKWFEESL